MSFKNFDRAFQAFSSSSIFVHHETMKTETQKLSGGRVLTDLSAIYAKRTKNGFCEKVISMECHGSMFGISDIIKEISTMRNGGFTVVDFAEFVNRSEVILGDMANYSALLLADNPGQIYLDIYDGETNRAATCVLLEDNDRVAMILFTKVPN